MTTIVLDSGDHVTVPSPELDADQSPASALTAARKDVLDADPTDPEEAVSATLRALERHRPSVSLPDILELRVVIDIDATDPESVFVDTTEQALSHLTNWH